MLNDIIIQYQLTFSIIESSTNPKTQLIAIVNFFRYCEEKKHTHQYDKFLNDFLPFIINIFKNSNVEFVDPYNLLVSKHLLRKAREKEENTIVLNEINAILELLNIQLLVLYYHLGEIENGIIVLNDLLNSKTVVESGVSLDKFENVNTHISSKNLSLVDPSIFKVNKAFDLLRRINYELNRLNSFSGNFVNILLVESENSKYGIHNFGIVQELFCAIDRNLSHENNNPYLENIIDSQNEGMEQIRKPLISSSNIILSKYGSKLNLLVNQIRLKFSNIKGIYKGTSFGVGASLLIPASYLNLINSRERYLISGAVAFTGSVDDKGNVLKLSEESIKTKVEAAFYSWIKYIVVPKENLNVVIDQLKELHSKYPKKELEVIGLNNVSEILVNNNVIKFEKDTPTEYLKKAAMRHRSTVFTLFSILLVSLTVIIVYNVIPRKFKPLPQTIRPLNIIYTPDRDTVWMFNNGDGAGGDTINFGEIAIGDALVFKFDLWNNDDKKEPIKIEVGGKDKDEFEVLWGIDKAQLESPEFVMPDIRQKMFLKYVPYKSLGDKNAELVIYKGNKPAERKTIYLKGKAGIYRTGYSLKFKDDDYGIINPARGNVLGKEFTIAFWFKTNIDNKRLLTSDNSKWTLSKLDIGIENSLLYVGMPQPKNQSTINSLRLLSKAKVKFNEWNYAVIIHKNNITKLILNDDKVEVKTEDEHCNQIEDYFILGGEYHPLQIKDNNIGYRNDGWELTFSELKMFSSALSDSEILKSKFEKEDYSNKKLLCYYDFEEGLGHFMFDKTKNDFNLELYGHPQRSLDRPPLTQNVKESLDTVKDKYVEVNRKGVIVFNKNIFEKRSSFTIQYDAKALSDEIKSNRTFFKPETMEITYHWYYQNDDSIAINFSSLLQGHKNFATVKRKLDYNWHRYTFDYSIENNRGRLFVDNELIAEYDFGDLVYDISRQNFCMYFGNNKNFDNPRYISENSAIDNIAIFNRVLNIDEIYKADVKNCKGLLAYWTFSKVDSHICYDELNHYPVFIWDEFDLHQK